MKTKNIWSLISIIIIFNLSIQTNFCQSIDTQIKEIRKKYSNIENNTKAAKTEEYEVDSGGGPFPISVTKYAKEGKPIKVILTDTSEHGTSKYHYYLNGSKIFFVFEINVWESSIQGPYFKEEKRIYIHNGKIIRILQKKKEDKIAANVDNADFSKLPNNDITKKVKDLDNFYQEILSNYQLSIKE